jgi:flavocytochrome c
MQALGLLALLWVASLAAADNLPTLKNSLLDSIASSTSSEDLTALLSKTLTKLQSLPVSRGASVAVVGGGLSGLTSALYLLDNDVNVILVDRAKFLGGNSAKASSGINGAYTSYQAELDVEDSEAAFLADSLDSSKRDRDSFTGGLIDRLVGDSATAVEWILDKADVAKPILVGQMGGHSNKRTHRPENGLSGAAFINGLEKAVSKYAESGQLILKMDSRVTGLDRDGDGDSAAWSLTVESGDDAITKLVVPTVIICTGGFAWPSDLLAKVAPDLINLGSTNAPTTTGDGITLATAVGAATVDLDMIQVHPTGFTDVPLGFREIPGEKRSLILCAEILRGSGGVLLDMRGERFIDELETRKTVTNAMNERAEKGTKPDFVIAIPPSAASAAQTHINIYTGKGLLHAVEGVEGVEAFIKKRINPDLDREMVTKSTFRDTSEGRGAFRRTATDLPESGTYYVGVVQPVLHYTMGGLRTSPDGKVLTSTDAPIPGLFAAGEVMGGVHGENRLGGSSLLDCVVFGLSAGKSAKATVKTTKEAGVQQALPGSTKGAAVSGGGERQRVVISGKTYDLTDFLDVHPGGPIDIENGEDLTARFVHAHGNDFSLLDRSSIQVISETGEVVEREVKFYEDYGTEGGSWREFMGRRAWFVLHSFAAKYPDSPTEADKRAMRNFIAAFGQLYPCKLCRGHLQQQLRDEALGPPAVESRMALSVWICELHNIVNVDLGKEQVECSAFGIDIMYLKDCGECEVKKPDDVAEMELFTGGTGGYDSYYAGPWDSDIYGRGDGLLNSVADSTDAWETNF